MLNYFEAVKLKAKISNCQMKLRPMVLVFLMAYSYLNPANAEFSATEILVTRNYILDQEFDYDTPRFAWTTRTDGDLWLAKVDAATGDFLPRDGKGILIDTNLFFANNGPEWIATSTGSRLIYTKRDDFGALRMSQATKVEGTNQWLTSDLENGENRITPVGSSNPNDPNPTIHYLNNELGQQRLSWRFINYPSSESDIPDSDGSVGTIGGRWVPGKRAIVFTAQYDERQVYYYDVIDEKLTQLTYDAGNKQTVFMWQAPEFNNNYVFFVSVKFPNRSEIHLYRLLDVDNDGEFNWTKFKTIVLPLGTYFWSPEPFVHNGKSYIFTMLSRANDRTDYSYPSQIWLFNIDPVEPLSRNLSNPNIIRLRLDPEVFVTDQGPFIYYGRYTSSAETDPFVSDKGYEGMYRADTGLGPKVSTSQ